MTCFSKNEYCKPCGLVRHILFFCLTQSMLEPTYIGGQHTTVFKETNSTLNSASTKCWLQTRCKMLTRHKMQSEKKDCCSHLISDNMPLHVIIQLTKCFLWSSYRSGIILHQIFSFNWISSLHSLHTMYTKFLYDITISIFTMEILYKNKWIRFS